ncbi:MAG: SIMPL domain-containing protein [Ignavibacteria bacterium]|nr:SIMPL domain-containing protein [Ignavibacteria bacterium]
MKNLIIFLLFSFAAFNAFSQDKPKVVEVTGNATIEVQPDMMQWELRIQDDSDELKPAVSNNDASTEKILAYLRDIGVKSEKVSTSGIRITKNYSYGDYKVKKFTVVNTIWFTVNDINLYGKLVSYFVSFDNVFINNSVLSSSLEIETRKQARTNALLAAKEKAEMMAGVYGKEIGDPIMISEEAVNPYYTNMTNNVYSPGTSYENEQAQNFSKGMLTVTARVKVVFALK